MPPPAAPHGTQLVSAYGEQTRASRWTAWLRHSFGRDHLRHSQREGRVFCHPANLRRARHLRAPVRRHAGNRASPSFPFALRLPFIQKRRHRAASLGQTVEAFLQFRLALSRCLSIGLNCALGPKEMRPLHRGKLSRTSRRSSSAPTRTPACPNPLSAHRLPRDTRIPRPAARPGLGLRDGWLNIIGGCCGTTPDHIREIAKAVRSFPPRAFLVASKPLRLSGLEPFTAHPADSEFHQSRRAHERHRLPALREAHSRRRLRCRARRRPPAGGGRGADHRHQHGRRHARRRRGHAEVLQPHHGGARHLAGADHGRFLEMGGHQGRPGMRPVARAS